MNQKKIRTLRANSDIRQDIVTFDSSVSSPSNIEETFLLQSAVTNAQGKAVISEVKNGTYSLEVLATDYNKVYNQTNLVVTSNKDVLINITPLYGVTIQVKNSSAANIEGAVVKLTPSNGIQETKNTDVNGQAIFTAVPGGVYTIEISKENYQTVSTAGVIEGGETVTFDYTLAIMPKLVQITTAQSNYQLDTSYKYVSLLIVGRGGNNYLTWNSWDSFILAGGTTGQIVYIPNILITDIVGGKIDKIEFSSVPNDQAWVTGTEYSITFPSKTYNYKAYNGQISSFQDAYSSKVPQNDKLYNYAVYNGKSSGGIAAHYRNNFYCSGSYGSQNAKEESASIAGAMMQPEGAPGGDGKYGFRSSYETKLFGNYTRPVASSITIPVQSIFGGTSKGASGYLNTESGQRTGASAWGGAGYGGSFYTSPDGGKTRIAGYGSGQECSPADDDAGSITKPGEGIFCIYYHNKPI